MAEVARSLGRIRFKEADLPQKILEKDLAEKHKLWIAFEDDISEYAELVRNIEDKVHQAVMEVRSISHPMLEKDIDKFAARVREEQDGIAKKKADEIETAYQYPLDPYGKKEQTWANRREVKKYQDEVNWKKLNDFLCEHYQQVEVHAKQIKKQLPFYLASIESLPTEPMALGLDNQDSGHLTYLLNIVGQQLSLANQAPTTKAEKQSLNKVLAIDAQPSLFALATYGFNKQLLDGLTHYLTTDPDVTKIFDRKQAGDNVALATAYGKLEAMLGHAGMKAYKWFQVLVVPAQETLHALQQAIAGTAGAMGGHAWDLAITLLIPGQLKTGWMRHPIQVLKPLLVADAVSSQGKVVINEEFDAAIKKMDDKLNAIRAKAKQKLGQGSKKSTGKIKQIKKAATAAMVEVLQQDMPKLLVFNKKELNNIYKNYSTQLLKSKSNFLQTNLSSDLQARQNRQTYTQSISNSVETLRTEVNKSINWAGGGMAVTGVLLNTWNTYTVFEQLDVDFENPEAHPWLDIAGLVSATSFLGAEFAAIWVNKNLGKISGNSELMKKTIATIAAGGDAVTVKEAALVKKYLMSVRWLGFVGGVATITDGFKIWITLRNEWDDKTVG